jgi:hypothetical protein
MLIYVTVAFSIWMLIDSIRRSAPGYWILIIIFVPFGALVYFFGVKLRDYRHLFSRLVGQRSRSADELMARYEAQPSQTNQLALAAAFYDEARLEQAASLFADVLEKDAAEPVALWGLARVRRSQGDHSESARLYERLIEVDPKHGDFGAVLEYAETLWDAGQRARCLEILDDIAQESQRLNHRLAFAHYLVLADEKAKAKTVLRRALQEHETSPSWLKQKERQWAGAATELLSKLDSA